MQEKGNLSINSENFMPIIKKWLYTDKDIFIRELVSNACDAVTKLQKLSMMGANPTFRNVSLKVARNAAKAATNRVTAGLRDEGLSLSRFLLVMVLPACRGVRPGNPLRATRRRSTRKSLGSRGSNRSCAVIRFTRRSATCVVCSSYLVVGQG